MLKQPEVLASLLYLALSYPAILIAFRNESAKRRNCLWIALGFAFVGLVVKLGYEMSNREKNHYELLQVSRHSSALEIRQSYKKVSRILHPDKNPSPDAAEMFGKVKSAYDVRFVTLKFPTFYNQFISNNCRYLYSLHCVIRLLWTKVNETFTTVSGKTRYRSIHVSMN